MSAESIALQLLADAQAYINGGGSAQRYHDARSRERLAAGECPECGLAIESHLDDPRFWIPRRCDLRPQGVAERIAQHQALTKVVR